MSLTMFNFRQLARLAILPLALAALPSAQAQTGVKAGVTLGPADGKNLEATDIDRVALGAPAPDFTLGTYGGGTLTLSSLRAKKNVVLVFYRGYWCPYCVAQLKELRSLLDAPLKNDTELLVVSIDPDEDTKVAITRIGADGVQPDFTFLSDPEHTVIARYGVLNPNGSRRGIPHPAAYVIDKAGIVRFRDVQTDYKVRPTNAQILAAVKSLPAK